QEDSGAAGQQLAEGGWQASSRFSRVALGLVAVSLEGPPSSPSSFCLFLPLGWSPAPSARPPPRLGPRFLRAGPRPASLPSPAYQIYSTRAARTQARSASAGSPLAGASGLCP